MSLFQNFFQTSDLFVSVGVSTENLDIKAQIGETLYNANYTKRIIIGTGVTVGSTTTTQPALTIPSGAGGRILIDNYGSIQGAGGAAGGGTGGDAILAQSTCTIENKSSGTIYAGGGGGGSGGNGGTGGQGSYQYITGSYTYCTWSGRYGCYAYGTAYNYGTAYSSGGAGGSGGSGGAGRGYGQSASSGSSGTAGSAGGTNAGSGGNGGDGGTGGDWGTSGGTGVTGATGVNGNYTNGSAGSSGVSGGLAGYYARASSSSLITLVNNGTIAGRTKLDGSRDEYFNLVSLLLHGNGTNATQNNTFVDSSTNNFTITRNGNTTQGTLSPFGDNWSNFFDGNGDNLTIGSTSAFSIATSTTPFTIECWIYPIADGGCIFSEQYTGAGNPVDISINMSSTTVDTTNGRIVSFGYYTGSAWVTAAIANSQLTLNSWTHVACVFTGSTTKIFYNGVDVTAASPTPATTWGRTGSSGNNWYIGQRWDTAASPYFSGYISNFRFVNGTALYTSTFTPPTTPLTAVTNTVLLTCQSNRFRDNSTNNFTITRNGDVSIQKFSPFAPTAAYSSSVIGGSGYFDGSGDYLTIANNTAFNLSGTTYTIEGWINPNGDYSNYRTIIAKRGGDTTATNAWEVYLRTSTGVLGFFNGTTYESSVTPAANAWNYFAAVFDGTNMNLYLNGSRVLQTAITNADTNATIYIGSYPTYSENFIGYISDLRITKGSALYSGTTMTVPTAPLTSSANTSLLLNFTNAGIIDNAGFNNIETVGNAQISTTQSKFGGSSLYFDGTGDYLASISQSNAFGTENFTIESWCYFIDGTANALRMIWTNYNTWTSQSIFFGKHTNNSGNVTVWVNNYSASVPLLVDPNLPPANSWVHYALVRNGNSWTLYRDGTSVATATYSGVATTNTLSQVGGNSEASGTYSMYGYLDDFRITKGLARYTANFTAPTAPFEDY